jgi:hypothetical protein
MRYDWEQSMDDAGELCDDCSRERDIKLQALRDQADED